MDDKMSPKEVGDQLGVTSETVRNWIKSGRLQGYRIGGRIFVRRTDLETFLNQPVYDPTDKSGGETP